MKDIDPKERMNMVKAFVNAANTYRDGTYGAYYRTVGRYLRYLRYRRYGTAVPRSYDARSPLGTFTGVHAKEFRPS